jgi:hypothetical protein
MSLLDLLVQRISEHPAVQGPALGQPQPGQLPLPSQGPQLPPFPSAPSPASQNPAPQTFAPDMTNQRRPAPDTTPQHPHWWGRLILGQGEFAPGTFLGTAADLGPTMGLRAGANAAMAYNAGDKTGMALAGLPLIPGAGPEAKLAAEAMDPAFAVASQSEKALARMEREAKLARPSAVAKGPIEGLHEGAGMEDAAYRRAMARKKPLPNY